MIKANEKMYTIKVKKGSLAYKWMENQDSYTGAFREAIELIVEEFGVGNLKEVRFNRHMSSSKSVIDTILQDMKVTASSIVFVSSFFFSS